MKKIMTYPEAAKYVKKNLVDGIRCNRCDAPVLKSEVKGYKYQCVFCDEDLYSFETYKGKPTRDYEVTDLIECVAGWEDEEPVEVDADKTLLEMLLEAGYPKEEVFHHCSDLYVFVTPLTKRVVSEWCKEHGYSMSLHCPVFEDQITGKPMFDCAFQYYDMDGGENQNGAV